MNLDHLLLIIAFAFYGLTGLGQCAIFLFVIGFALRVWQYTKVRKSLNTLDETLKKLQRNMAAYSNSDSSGSRPDSSRNPWRS